LIRITFNTQNYVADENGFVFVLVNGSDVHMKNGYCQLTISGNKCGAGLLIVKEATEGSVISILTSTHRHQRISLFNLSIYHYSNFYSFQYSDDSYDDNRILREVNLMVNVVEQLQAAGAPTQGLLKSRRCVTRSMESDTLGKLETRIIIDVICKFIFFHQHLFNILSFQWNSTGPKMRRQ
jgi:hypothetical protein